jgi:hypothetical protein
MNAQQSIEMTMQIYEARDAAKFIHGARYPQKMQEYGAILRKVMAAKNVNEIRAAILLSEHTESPYQRMDILAAVVELIEPSGVAA